MRLKFLVVFMATLLLTVVVPDKPTSRFTQDQRVTAIVFSDACEMSNYICKGIPVPMLRRSASLGEVTVRGAYWNGSNVIWLDEPLRGTQLWLTTLHEIIHYLQHKNTASRYEPDSLLRCVLEREAWTLVEQYIGVLHAPQTYRRSLEDWRTLYGCHDRRERVNKKLMHDVVEREET
ncbi:MAG: hypothetical protein J3T61_11625 [Candidatus Brocadiales bacterium]|nr:hypothetical protein [Candidatus Bathyanammoxibius sp.]